MDEEVDLNETSITRLVDMFPAPRLDPPDEPKEVSRGDREHAFVLLG